MDDSHAPTNWREFLGRIMKDPRERNAIAAKIRVNPLTLIRWTNGDSMPRPYNLKALLNALPDHRDKLLAALPDELRKPLLAIDEKSGSGIDFEIPIAFYRRVLRDNAMLAETLHCDSLCDLILQQALQQLDPQRVGMEITIAKCMAQDEQGKIRSLREDIGLGTGQWRRSLHERTMFLGSESLAGFVVRTGKSRAIQNHEEGKHFFPAHWVEGEESAMACPIMHQHLIVGCFLISCRMPNYFTEQECQSLAQDYADLCTVAFDDRDFCDLRMIDLQKMPSYEEQRVYIERFRPRVSERMKQSVREGHPMSVQQAEHEIWRQIEQELFMA